MAATSQDAASPATDLFLQLLIRQCGRASHVVIRSFGDGAWHQFSGGDLAAHLGRMSATWIEQKESLCAGGNSRPTIAFVVRNSYTGFIGTLGAILAGFDVLCLSPNKSISDIEFFVKKLKVCALAADTVEMAQELKTLGKPVFKLNDLTWRARDSHVEPKIYDSLRDGKYDPSQLGQFHFVSIGSDGTKRTVALAPQVLVSVAMQFISRANVPASFFWKSVELLPPATPFAFLSRWSIMLKNGVIGFPNLDSDWETNLRILRPTCLFTSDIELGQVCNFIQEVGERATHKPRVLLSRGIEKTRRVLQSKKIVRIPEPLIHFTRRRLRDASRLASGQAYVEEAVEDLRFVVCGLTSARPEYVDILEKMGVVVIETYGTTDAGGMLTTNTYREPHLNLIGSPLPHVSLRLGEDSTLQYKITDPIFASHNQWIETTDVVKMTPYGFTLTGRAKHLFVGPGGTVVSPIKIERLLSAHPLIQDACVVGDKMPYLSVLLVLHPEAMAQYAVDPEGVKEHVAKLIGEINETLPRNVTIKKFRIADKAFQENLGEKLSNGEINRARIVQHYAEAINSMYL